MSRLRRMSRARPNWSASIQRRLLVPTLPRAKLQKSQAALHALVTATLQSAGPPRVMRRSMSQDLEAKLVTLKEPVLETASRFARGNALKRTPTTSLNPHVGAAGIRLLRWRKRRHPTFPGVCMDVNTKGLREEKFVRV